LGEKINYRRVLPLGKTFRTNLNCEGAKKPEPAGTPEKTPDLTLIKQHKVYNLSSLGEREDKETRCLPCKRNTRT